MQDRTNRGTYTIRDSRGQSHTVEGDPNSLTLQDALGEVGKQGGEQWQKGQSRVRYQGKEFGDNDLNKSFKDLGIQPGSTIEVVTT